MTRGLESGAPTDSQRVKAAAKRIGVVSGFSVVLCIDLLAPLVAEKTGFDVAVLAVVTSAAALIENPRVEADLQAMATASLASMAKIYRHRAAAGRKSAFLEEVVAQKTAGTLLQWVKDRWNQCPKTTAEARVRDATK